MKTNSDLDAEIFIARRDAFRKTPVYKLTDFICNAVIPHWIHKKTVDNKEYGQPMLDMDLSIKKKRAVKLGINSDIMEELTTLLNKYLQEMKESSNP